MDTQTNKSGSWAGGRSRTKEGHTTKKGWKHNERHALGRQDQRQGGEPTRLGGQGFLDVLLDPPQQVRPEHLVQLGDLWQRAKHRSRICPHTKETAGEKGSVSGVKLQSFAIKAPKNTQGEANQGR